MKKIKKRRNLIIIDDQGFLYELRPGDRYTLVLESDLVGPEMTGTLQTRVQLHWDGKTLSRGRVVEL
jgi:hypothetical protein